MTWVRSWAGKIALLAFGVGLPLLVAEGVLRVMARREPGGKEQVERNHHTESDPVLGWRKRPGAHATYVRRDCRSEFQVNAKGLRGPERPYSKPPGTVRVLVLGDSFVCPSTSPPTHTGTRAARPSRRRRQERFSSIEGN